MEWARSQVVSRQAVRSRVQRTAGTSYPGTMPCYEYRCRQCGTTFELHRPMSEASAAASCPNGHGDTVKLLSTVAVTRGSGGRSAPACAGAVDGGCSQAAARGTSCCGGGGCC